MGDRWEGGVHHCLIAPNVKLAGGSSPLGVLLRCAPLRVALAGGGGDGRRRRGESGVSSYERLTILRLIQWYNWCIHVQCVGISSGK